MNRLRDFWATLNLRGRLALLCDGASLLGLALLTAGGALVYAPMALILPGVFLLVFGIWGARRCS